jgi:hypothetical protein
LVELQTVHTGVYLKQYISEPRRLDIDLCFNFKAFAADNSTNSKNGFVGLFFAILRPLCGNVMGLAIFPVPPVLGSITVLDCEDNNGDLPAVNLINPDNLRITCWAGDVLAVYPPFFFSTPEQIGGIHGCTLAMLQFCYSCERIPRSLFSCKGFDALRI